MSKIKVAKVVVVRHEGPSKECDKPKEFVGENALSEAQVQMMRWGHTAPKDGGYDKCGFTITFEDGYVYQGRYDLVYGGNDDGKNTIRDHVLRHLEFIAGKYRPWHMDDRQYAGVMKRYESMKAEAVEFLEKYEL